MRNFIQTAYAPLLAFKKLTSPFRAVSLCSVRRPLIFLLLLCFGWTLNPLQGMLPHRLPENGAFCMDSDGGTTPSEGPRSRDRDCHQCPHGQSPEHSGDCCVEQDHRRDTAPSNSLRRLSAMDWLVTAPPVLEWREWLRPVAQDKPPAPSGYPPLTPVRGRQRQAVLSIWTV